MRRTVEFAIWTVIIIAATWSPAQAGPCDNAASSYEAVTCFDRQYKTADKRLNAVYKKQRADLDDTAKKLLRNAQRAWIKFRDMECLRAGDASRGGTDATIIGLICQTVLTERRIKDIEGVLLNQIQGRNETDGFYWKDGNPLFETFDCKNYLDARLALLPGYDLKTAQPTLMAQVHIGTHTLDFPIGGNNNNAFCSAEISMSVTDSASACPGLRLDDGKCDAFFISWDKQTQAFRWQRN